MPGSKGEKMTDEPDWIAAYLLFYEPQFMKILFTKIWTWHFDQPTSSNFVQLFFALKNVDWANPTYLWFGICPNFRSFFLDLLPSLFRSLKQIQTRWIRYILKASNIEHDFTYSSETFTFQSNHQLFAIVLHLFFGPCHIGFVPGKSFWNRV